MTFISGQRWWLTLAMACCAQPVLAENTSVARDICLLEALRSAGEDTTVAEIRNRCDRIDPSDIESAEVKSTEKNALPQNLSLEHPKDQATDEQKAQEQQVAKLGAAKRRSVLEEATVQNRFALEPHRPTYFLPLVFLDKPNNEPFKRDYNSNLDRYEMQFQISIKATLAKGVLFDRGKLYAGYTNHSFWQAYNRGVSRPFRETNHEPELWLEFQSPLTFAGFENLTNSVGINHQSNGRAGVASRSWNRVIFGSVWAKNDFALGARAWYRIPESDKDYEGDPRGDDNPDITDYYGYSDVQFAYAKGEHTWGLKLRNYIAGEHRGAAEFTWSFPMGKRVGGYLKYFNGYGESLIDYNAKTQSIGLGFELNDWL